MSKLDWDEILSEYECRSGTQKEFCKQRGITPAMLQYHYGKSKKREVFVPFDLRGSSGGSVFVEFPSGLKLTINGS